MPPPRHDDPRIARIVEFFERLTREDVARLGAIYAADVRFKDPFNELRGLAGVQRVYAEMFVALDAPRFVVHDIAVAGEHCFLTWDFLFRQRRLGDRVVRGCSHLQLDADGRIAVHRDYWDAAEELYEHLPLVGALMRWLRRRLAA